MRRIGPDAMAGAAMVVVAIGVGAPVYLGLSDPKVPRSVWLLTFAVTLAGMVLTASDPRARSRRGIAGIAVAALGSWTLVLSTTGMDIIAILMVLVAALSVYVLPFGWVSGVIFANCLVLGIDGAISGDPVATTATVLFYLLIQFASALSCLALLHEQRLRRELHATNVELRAAGALLAESARTAERLRISRDLHDSVGHHLTVLALELEAARHQSGEASAAHIERAGSVAKDLLGHVRETVGELRHEPGDLATALGSLACDIPGLDVGIEVSPAATHDLGEPEQVTLVRAVQEILSNTIRHAEGRHLTISIDRDSAGDIVLTALDDGRGSADHRPDAAPPLGNGLRGLVERFEGHGGHVAFDGGRGFRVTARIPTR